MFTQTIRANLREIILATGEAMTYGHGIVMYLMSLFIIFFPLSMKFNRLATEYRWYFSFV